MTKAPGELEPTPKRITKAERDARKAFRQVDAEKAITEHEIAQKAFSNNRERLKAERLAREAAEKAKPWAPEEDQRLQALALSGASVAEMAQQMKRSEEAVRSRAYRLKILVAKSRKLRLKAKGK